MGRHLGIDFEWILVDFGKQVGRENRAKRNQKWYRKTIEKMKGNKMAQKSQQEAPKHRGRGVPGPRGGPPLQGGTVLWGPRNAAPGL